MSRCMPFLLSMILIPAAVACGEQDDPNNSNAEPLQPGSQCYGPSGPMAAVPECASTSFCVPQTLDIVRDASTCVGDGCRFTYAMNAGDTLTYEDEEVFVFLRFDEPIGGITTTQQLLDAFQHVNFMRKYPGDAAKIEETPIQFESTEDPNRFEVFELNNGSLHVRLSFTLASPYRWVHSNDPNCGDDDMMGICVCRYQIPPQMGVVELNLPADIPGAM